MAREHKISVSSHFPQPSTTSMFSLMHLASNPPSQSSSVIRLRRKSSTTPLRINMVSASEQATVRDRSKLVIVEAQRIIAVVDDALLSLQVVSRIASVCENHEYFEHFLGRDLSTAFSNVCTALNYSCDSQERDLTSKLMIAQSDTIHTLNKLSGEEKLAAYSTSSLRRIRDLIKKIVRLLLKKRGIFNMICGDTMPSPSVMDFMFHLEELRGFVYEKFTISDEKDKQEIKYFQEAPSREEVYKIEINSLEDELLGVKLAAAKETSVLKDRIARLEDDIEKMVTISSEAILQKRKDAIAEIEYEERTSKAERASLEVELNEIKTQYEKDIWRNRENELSLRRRNFKLETKVANWIEKYDHDMEERLILYEQISEEYIKERDELIKLEAEFEPINQAYNALLEERAQKERLRQLQLEHDEILYKAAVILQKYVRRFLARCLVRRLNARVARGKAKQKIFIPIRISRHAPTKHSKPPPPSPFRSGPKQLVGSLSPMR